MRNAFFQKLTQQFEEDRSIIFITGDLGYKLFDPLVEIDKHRVFNVGIREAAMVGFAAGLAKRGFRPFIYSITPFITLRCLEQIKIDLSYNRNRVVVVGVGGGYAYGPNGPTHFGLEDIGIFNTLPDFNILTPADPFEVVACLEHIQHCDKPVYLRLGRNKEPQLYSHPPTANSVLKPSYFANGPDGLIVCNGFILNEVLKSLLLLEEKCVRPSVVQVCGFRPFPDEFFDHLIGDQALLSVEEHVSSGGLGQELARLIAHKRSATPFITLCAPDKYLDKCLDREAALTWAGINAANIAKNFLSLMNNK